MKKILVVSQYFYPEQFRINDMCMEWVKSGYRVTVVTGIPNYPQGEFFDGYDKNNKRTETWNGINIIRLPILPRKTGSKNLIKNYLSFVWAGFWWNVKTRIKADYVFCFELSPMTQALVAVWYAKKHKIPCYLYVQDLWPENVEIVTGINNPLIIKPISAMVNYIYKYSTHIFATSPSFVREIKKRCKNKKKVSCLPQYAEDFYEPTDRETAKKRCPEIPDDDSFKICFTGNIGQAQGLEILPRAARLLKDENIKFIIIGDGRYKKMFEKSIRDNAVNDKFLLIERQPPEKIPYFLGCCDVAFLSFMDNELLAKTIPAKLQSYMACGMPVIAAVSGETKRIIEEAGCGLCVEMGNARMLAEKIKRIRQMDLSGMSNNSRSYFESHFSKQEFFEKLQIYFE